MLSELKRGHLIIAVLMLVLLFGAGARYGQYLERRNLKEVAVIATDGGMTTPSANSSQAQSTETTEVTVHVAGAVFSPGVFTLKEGSRVVDGIGLAQARPEADLDALNLAKKLTDGERILVPLKKTAVQEGDTPVQTAGDGSISAGDPSASGLININTAGAGELESLPGIGPAKAAVILKYREENGPFASVEDLDKVSGIGPATLNNLKDKITF